MENFGVMGITIKYLYQIKCGTGLLQKDVNLLDLEEDGQLVYNKQEVLRMKTGKSERIGG
jgi:hypothetical protein